MLTWFILLSWCGLPFEETWEVHNDDLEEPWSYIRAVTSPSGTTYVFDLGSSRITVIDNDGEVIKVFGGRGEGPGLIQGSGRLQFLPRSNRLAVFEGNGRSLSLFEADGAFVSRVAIPREIAQSGIILEPGKVAFNARQRMHGDDGGGAEVMIATFQLNEVRTPVTPTDPITIRILSSAEHEPWNTKPSVGGAISFLWEAKLKTAVSPDHRRFFAGSSLNVDFSVFDPTTGKSIMHITDTLPRKPLTDEDIEKANAMMQIGDKIITAKDFDHEETWPALESITVDTLNRLWVKRNPVDPGTAIFVVYGTDGKRTGVWQMPSHFKLVHAGDQHLWLSAQSKQTEDWMLMKTGYQLK